MRPGHCSISTPSSTLSVVLIFLLSKAIMVLSKKLVVFLVLQAIVVAVAVIWSKRHPDPEAFLQKKTLASNNPNLRFVASFLGQFMGFNPRASTSKSLEGQRILITGGTRGIGYEISKGLVERGANVIIAARNLTRGHAAVESILKDTVSKSKVEFLPVDLSDLESVSNLVEQVKDLGPFDQLIQNAAYWPAKYQDSPQGHEITYAANLLGPHLLLRKLLQENVLKPDAKVIITAGELYVILQGTQDEGCSSDFEYNDDAQTAYCWSKLGVMTLFDQYVQ